MSQEVAYSLEKRMNVDADLAYDLYWDKQIFDKSKFKCPTPTCQAKFTCANMNIAEHDLKQSPHFRKHPSTDHNSSCQFHEDNTVSSNYSDSLSTRQNQTKSNDEIFEFCRPPSHFKDYNADSEDQETKTNTRIRSSNTTSTTNKQRYYTLRKVVNKYVTYRLNSQLETKTIFIKEDRTYKELFKGIYKQGFESITKPYVFWQKAWVGRTKNKDAYRIRFSEPFTYEGKEIKPTIYISDTVVDESFGKNLLKTRLSNALSNKSPDVVIFVYGEPKYTEYNGGSIGFFLESLDLLEIRPAKYFYKSLGGVKNSVSV